MLLAILGKGEHVLLPLLVLLHPDSKLGDLLHVEMLGVVLLPILDTGESVLQVLVLKSPLLNTPVLLTSMT